MNIVLITERCGTRSGWERYSTDLIRALRAHGHEVDVLARSGEVSYRVPLPSPLSYKLLSIVSFPLALGFYLSHRRALRRCDVIHCVVESYAPFTRMLAALARKPYVLTVHGSYGVKTLSGHFGRLQKTSYIGAIGIICVSMYSKERLLERVPLTRVTVIPNGVDTDLFEVSHKTRNPHLLFSVGAVKPRKGQHLVVEALVKVKETVPDVRYVVAGSLDSHPEYVRQLKQCIEDRGLQKNVKLEGRVSAERLKELYATGSVFILTPVSSDTDFEGFGLVYLEANASGIPVVGMEGSGATDAIADGRSGLIALEGDIDDLAQKLATILTDATLRERLAAGAREWAHEHEWRVIVGQYEAVYRSCV